MKRNSVIVHDTHVQNYHSIIVICLHGYVDGKEFLAPSYLMFIIPVDDEAGIARKHYSEPLLMTPKNASYTNLIFLHDIVFLEESIYLGYVHIKAHVETTGSRRCRNAGYVGNVFGYLAILSNSDPFIHMIDVR